MPKAKIMGLIEWDRLTLAVTAVLTYTSLHLEQINLLLSVIVKIATFINIVVYLIVNRKRIIKGIKDIFKRKK